jgi:hypothetical protein
MSNLWFEGKKTFNILLTEEDLKMLVMILEAGSYGGLADEKAMVKDRILFQLRGQL